MEFRELPADEDAVRRYVEDLWLPYQRDLAAVVDDHDLVDGEDVADSEVDFRLGKLDSETYEMLVAVDPEERDEGDSGVADADKGDGKDADGGDDKDADAAGTPVGFIATDVDEAPEVFERPDRLLVCDFYVVEAYRGRGLAGDLLARAVERAREEGCPELALEVDVDNERALAFYEKVGFGTARMEMHAAVEDVESAVE